MQIDPEITSNISYNDFKQEIIDDYTLAVTSRACSIL